MDGVLWPGSTDALSGSFQLSAAETQHIKQVFVCSKMLDDRTHKTPSTSAVIRFAGDRETSGGRRESSQMKKAQKNVNFV